MAADPQVDVEGEENPLTGLKDQQEPDKQEVNTNPDPDVSLAEETARASGWVTQEEWVEQGKDPDQWVDAREFNYRGELMDRIRKQSKENRYMNLKLEKMEQVIKKLVDKNKEISQGQREDLEYSLKARKRQALEEDDHDTVIAVDDQLRKLETVPEEDDTDFEVEDRYQGIPDAVVDWLEDPRNSWYAQDAAMRAVADDAALSAKRNNPNMTPEQILTAAEMEVRQRFPERFGGRRKQQSSSVNEPSQSGPGKGKSKKDPTAGRSYEEIKVAKDFVAMGAYESVEDYFKDLDGGA